jgi:hypothetical protein
MTSSDRAPYHPDWPPWACCLWNVEPDPGFIWLFANGVWGDRTGKTFEKVGAWLKVGRNPEDRPKEMLPVDTEVRKLAKTHSSLVPEDNPFVLGRLSVLNGYWEGCLREFLKRREAEVVKRDRKIRKMVAGYRARLEEARSLLDSMSPLRSDIEQIQAFDNAVEAIDDVEHSLMHKGGQPGAPFHVGFADGVADGYRLLSGRKPRLGSAPFLNWVMACAASLDEADEPPPSKSAEEWHYLIRTMIDTRPVWLDKPFKEYSQEESDAFNRRALKLLRKKRGRISPPPTPSAKQL